MYTFEEITKRMNGYYTCIEEYEIVFQTLLGSKNKAKSLIKEVMEFNRTNFTYLSDDLACAKCLLMFGFTEKTTISTLKLLINTKLYYGCDFKKLIRIYTQVKIRNKLHHEEILQLASLGISINFFYDALGITEKEFVKRQKMGEISFSNIKTAFKQQMKYHQLENPLLLHQ